MAHTVIMGVNILYSLRCTLRSVYGNLVAELPIEIRCALEDAPGRDVRWGYAKVHPTVTLIKCGPKSRTDMGF